MTSLTGQQARKYKANHEVAPAESSKVAPEPCRETTADGHFLEYNLAIKCQQGGSSVVVLHPRRDPGEAQVTCNWLID